MEVFLSFTPSSKTIDIVFVAGIVTRQALQAGHVDVEARTG
jgi:hypothetical protein